MRIVVQRVKSAKVEVDGKVVSSIGQGLLCLVGLREGDTEASAAMMCRKLLRLRCFHSSDTGRAWDKSVQDVGGEVLLVSQFTLYANLKKPRPDYHRAMPTQQAVEFYAAFVREVQAAYVADRVKDGIFGAMMDVSLVNDGPVTFTFDTD